MSAQRVDPTGFYARVGKRVFDVLVGAALAIVALPVTIALAVVSAIQFRANPIFVQRRTGWHGRTIAFPKLRTLPKDTPPALGKYDVATDVKIPRFGRILRRWHLDELPQLYLVPFGVMSLVGPRPEMVELADRYDPEFARLRQSVRPGCTGLWQVGESNPRMIYEAPEYDFVYVTTLSFGMDVWILWRTAVLWLTWGRVRTPLRQVPATTETTDAVTAAADPERATGLSIGPAVAEPALVGEESTGGE